MPAMAAARRRAWCKDALAALLVCATLLLAAACSLPNGPSSSSAASAPGPTPAPAPPEVKDLFGRGVEIDGHGTSQTDDIAPDYTGGLNIGIEMVRITHDGRSTFIVSDTQGTQSETLVQAIGPYTGVRPLVVEDTISFQVTADGNWTLQVQPLGSAGTPTFSGTGDAVSQFFDPPGPMTWNVSHDGQTTFFVNAHCVGGSIVVENSSGAVQDSPQVQFPRGPCFWEVRADGNFSLQPQP